MLSDVISYAGSGIIWNFDNLPISQYTLEGLKSAKYTRLTAIQRAALPHTLAGKDVLGAAKTGSGKTLAFLIPVSALLMNPLDTRSHNLHDQCGIVKFLVNLPSSCYTLEVLKSAGYTWLTAI